MCMSAMHAQKHPLYCMHCITHSVGMGHRTCVLMNCILALSSLAHSITWCYDCFQAIYMSLLKAMGNLLIYSLQWTRRLLERLEPSLTVWIKGISKPPKGFIQTFTCFQKRKWSHSVVAFCQPILFNTLPPRLLLQGLFYLQDRIVCSFFVCLFVFISCWILLH